MAMSRTNPRVRLRRVARPTTPAADAIFRTEADPAEVPGSVMRHPPSVPSQKTLDFPPRLL
jgi:hypothetical protein